MHMKLTVELVPNSSHYKNVRSMVHPKEWDKLRKMTYRRANYKCEVCTSKGPKWPVECHEEWTYNMKTGIQKLKRLVALCPACHEVKHFGRAQMLGRAEAALKHFCKINKTTKREAHSYLDKAFNLYEERSLHKWTVNINAIKQLL